MRVFLVEWSTDILVEVAKKLQTKGAEIVYFTTAKDQEKIKKDFPKTIYHNTFAAVGGLPAQGVDCSGFEPLSKDFIFALHECESQALTMMNRMDYSDVSFYRRKELYYQQLKYWKGVLEKFKPEAIVFSVTPHMVYDFVLYSVARELCIKTIMFDVIKLAERLLVLEDIKENGKAVQDYLVNHPENAKVENLSEEAKSYYLKMTDLSATYYPFYITGQRFQKREKVSFLPSISGILKSVKQGDFFSKALIKIKGPWGILKRKSALTSFDPDLFGLKFAREKKKWQKIRQGFKKEYQNLAVAVDLKKPFVFLPLQYQPERSTSPMAGVFADQFLIAEILSFALPPGWEIYIKEHPSQWAEKGVHAQQGRFSGYYKKLSKIKNVKLAKMDISTNDLILNSRAVATATGTAGWEALLKGKPALIFGWPFYQFAEGVFRISNVEECQMALRKIRDGFLPDKQKVLNYLVAIDRLAILAHIGHRFEKDLNLSDEESACNVVKAIYEKL